MADTRLSDAFHILRALVHRSLGWLGPEPRLEVKVALADHVRDDARSLGEVLSHCEPVAPGEHAGRLLQRVDGCDSSAEYLEAAYGELKPALIAMAHGHLRAVDPLAEEPLLRLLTNLLHDQERHVSELPPRGTHTPPGTDAPAARDRYLDPLTDHDEGPCALVHDLMAAELCAAERAARSSHDQPELPWDAHADLVGQTWEAMRTVQACDRLLTEELGCRWGDHAVLTDIDASELERRRAAAAPVLEAAGWG